MRSKETGMLFGTIPSDNEETEFEGYTTEEAIKKAEKILGVDREEMKIKVVCEEKKGLFGMRGSKQAKIKVIKK